VIREQPKNHDLRIRRCVVTGKKYDQNELLKFTLNPKGGVVLDINRKLPGRGMWVYPERSALVKAANGNHFSRAARRNVEISADFLYTIDRKLVDYLTGILSLGRKSGVVVAGFEKVRLGISENTITVLVQASDGSDRQGRKLIPRDVSCQCYRCLSSTELGEPFGKESVVYVGVKDGPMAHGIAIAAQKLERMRGMEGFQATLPDLAS